MKRIFMLIVVACCCSTGNSQDVVQWKFSVKKITGKIYEIHLTPVVEHPWYIYSLHARGGVALPTTFAFNKHPLVILDGEVKEIGKQEDFIQVVQLKTHVKINLTGTVKYMACNGEQCLPPKTEAFNVIIK